MNNLETMRHLEKKFRACNSTETAKIIFGILSSIKKEKGLEVDNVNQLLFELVMLKRDTMDFIIQQVKFKQKLFGSKHINYFRQTVQNLAAEPRKVYVSSKLKVNI